MKLKLCIVIGLLTFMLCACGEQQKEMIPDNVAENSVEQESIEQGSSESMELPSAEKETGAEDDAESSMENVQEESTETQDNTTEQWCSAYQEILADWKVIDKYGDFEYLKMYFGTEYQFDKYWLCDVNGDEVPELFLHSDYMNITAVFTYCEEEIRFLMYDVIYGVNKETGDVVIEGHWHGAGGSGVDEWTVYHLTEIEAVYAYYIDFIREYEELEIENPYTVYDATIGEFEKQPNGNEYDEIYVVHVKPCTMKSKFQQYELSDLTGLDVIQ